MPKYSSKLIILRGNSGSGKSSVAKKLRDSAKSTNKIAIVEQDYLRRFVLKEKESSDGDNLKLIEQTVKFALERNYNVILEGILYSPSYDKVLKYLTKQTPYHFMYYFDVSLDETLKRHKSKPNAHEFGEKEMRGWYRHRNLLGFGNEKVIPESSTLDNTIKTILAETGL